MGNSVIPLAIDGLVDKLTAWPAFAADTDLQIIDGQPSGAYLLDRIVAVAFGEDDPAITGHQAPAELGARRRKEEFGIRCLVSVTSMDDMRRVRADCFDIYAEVEDCLRTYPQFAGATTYGDIREYSYSQDETDNGAVATIVFVVNVWPFHRF